MNSCFTLSSSGRIGAAITLSLVLAPSLWAEGIIAAQGSGVQVTGSAGGPAVVNIVKPDERGLSHNRFNDYNVGKEGVLVNNGVAASMSQLTGQKLEGNAQLSGTAASVIFSEVVSRNPSLMLGKQEIVGRAADFVLANPNGITCNGCGFINTPRVSLVVGSVQLDDGRIKSLRAANDGSVLSIGTGGMQGGDVVDLIAPRVDAEGTLVAVSGINAVTGHGSVEYASGMTDPVKVAAANGQVDSAYLGGMQAGRIRIISTDQGAGVNLGGVVRATEMVLADVQGKLDLNAADIKATAVALAGDTVSAHARVTSKSEMTGTHDESWFIWQTGATDTTQSVSSTEVDRTRIEGKLLKVIANHDIDLQATDIKMGDIALHGENITLDGVVDQARNSADLAAWKNSWSRNQHTELDRQQQIGSQLTASHNVDLEASGRIDAQGASVTAGNDAVFHAGKDLRLSGVVEQDNQIDRGSRYLEGDGLITGQWDNEQQTQRVKATAVNATGKIDLDAGGNLEVQGTRLQAGGDIAIHAGGSVSIGTQIINNNQVSNDAFTRWGGIAGGESKHERTEQLQNVASAVLAQGALKVAAEHDIKIVGSEVSGGHGAMAQARSGELEVKPATDVLSRSVDDQSRGVFSVPTHGQKGSSTQQTVQGAQVASAADLQLDGQGIGVEGSRIEAAGKLSMNAGGDLKVAAAEQQAHAQSDKTTLSFNANAGLSNGKGGGVQASIGLTHQADTTQRDQLTHVASSLSGGSVSLEATGAVALTGSEVMAKSGSASLSGQSLALDAAYDQTLTQSNATTLNAGVHWDASLKKAGTGIGIGLAQQSDRVDSTAALGTRVSAAEEVKLDAGKGALHSEGATVSAGSVLTVNAGQIDNLAAQTRRDETRTQSHWSGDSTVSVDYQAVTTPFGKVVSDLKSGSLSAAKTDLSSIVDVVKGGVDKLRKKDWKGAFNELKKLGMPSGGGDVTLQGDHQTSVQHAEGASGSQFAGASVRVRSAGAMHDQGSVYQAGSGSVAIAANDLKFDAATTRSDNSVQTQSGGGEFHVSTTTGRDPRFAGNLKATSESDDQSALAVQAGAIVAKDGIQLDIARDARFQGGRLDAGSGAVSVVAGNDMRFDEVRQQSQDSVSRYSGVATGDVSEIPGANAKAASSLGGGGQLGWRVSRQNTQNSGAEVAQVTGAAGVQLKAGHDLSVSGSHLGTGTTPAAQAEVALQAGRRIDIQSVSQSGTLSVLSSDGSLSGQARSSGPVAGKIEGKIASRSTARDGQSQATIEAARVTLNSGSDTRIDGGVIQADTVGGQIGGHLQITSPRVHEQALNVTADLGVATPDLTKVFSKEGSVLQGHVQFESDTLDAVSQISRLTGSRQVDLQVAGKTMLDGARIESNDLSSPAAGKVVMQTVPGKLERTEAAMGAAGSPVEIMTQTAKDVLTGKLPFGMQHQQTTEDKSVAGGVGGVSQKP